MTNVKFVTSPTIDSLHMENLMWCSVVIDDIEYELYAEDLIPANCTDIDAFNSESYKRLKDDIAAQAVEVGYNPSGLSFN